MRAFAGRGDTWTVAFDTWTVAFDGTYVPRRGKMPATAVPRVAAAFTELDLDLRAALVPVRAPSLPGWIQQIQIRLEMAH